MGGFSKRSLWNRVTLVAIVLAGGCQIPPSPSTDSPPQLTPMSTGEMRVSQQLIVKFKRNTIARDAAGIAHLSAVTQVLLEHVRPMSGDACVIKQLANNAAGLSRGQEMLKLKKAVVPRNSREPKVTYSYPFVPRDWRLYVLAPTQTPPKNSSAWNLCCSAPAGAGDNRSLIEQCFRGSHGHAFVARTHEGRESLDRLVSMLASGGSRLL
jgi:hypothetical protein